MAKKELPAEITSHDLLKTLALWLMVIDHVGYFFMPEHEFLRLIGRFSAPIWFFLIGYAMTRKLEPRLWIALGVMAVGNYLLDGYTLPVTILATFLLIRLSIDQIMARANQQFEVLFAWSWIFFLLAVPTGLLVEYGTLGFAYAAVGYLVRQRDTSALKPDRIYAFCFLSAMSYAVIQTVWFDFPVLYGILLGVGLICVTFALTSFKTETYPTLTKYSGPFAILIKLTGRRTLEFYVAHFLLFKYIALYGTEPFDWFSRI